MKCCTANFLLVVKKGDSRTRLSPFQSLSTSRGWRLAYVAKAISLVARRYADGCVFESQVLHYFLCLLLLLCLFFRVQSKYLSLCPIICISLNIKTDTWEMGAQEQASWRSCFYNGAVSCEASRKSAAEWRKKRNVNEHEPLTTATISCPHCPRLFRERIELTNYKP